MTKGFFRERKHYSLQEITDNLINTNMEETRRIVGILKKYGVVKAVKKNKPDFDDLSNEDIVLTDVIDSSSDIEYIFDYVGVVVIEGQVFKCYPKYIKSTEHLFENLKQVLKVIKKYNASEQLIYLFNGEDDSKIFNRLAVSIHLLETYYADGLYTNQKEIIETNGEGEILWDKTINETFAIIQNNKPYYVELQTKNTIDNDYDYFRRLHECVLTQCSRELSDAGLLELFELTEVELTQEEMSDLEFIKAYNGKCAYCGASIDLIKKTEFEIDHFLYEKAPIFATKKDAGYMENLILSCHDCNHNKNSFWIEKEEMDTLNPDGEKIKNVFIRDDKYYIRINDEFKENTTIEGFYNKLCLGSELHRLDYLIMNIIGLQRYCEDNSDLYVGLGKILDIIREKRNIM